MEVKRFTKELQKAVRNFERRAKRYGAIIEPTEVEAGADCLQLGCTIETDPIEGDCVRMYCDIEIEGDEFINLGCTINGYPA